jgi:hypothetical protein
MKKTIFQKLLNAKTYCIFMLSVFAFYSSCQVFLNRYFVLHVLSTALFEPVFYIIMMFFRHNALGYFWDDDSMWPLAVLLRVVLFGLFWYLMNLPFLYYLKTKSKTHLILFILILIPVFVSWAFFLIFAAFFSLS